MGYMTAYNLEAKCGNFTEEKLEAINAWLRHNEVIGYALREGTFTGTADLCAWDMHDEVKWYEADEDMKELSKAFPDVTFRLHGEGEDHGDVWDYYWLNGHGEICCAVIRMPEPSRISW